MQHRHLTHQQFTLAAIDDIIARGKRRDWAELRRAALADQSALQQLQVQLANPLPYDLEELNLIEYKNLDPRWHDWRTVKAACIDCATLIFDQIVGLDI